jgi:hypothetical protein
MPSHEIELDNELYNKLNEVLNANKDQFKDLDELVNHILTLTFEPKTMPELRAKIEATLKEITVLKRRQSK